VNPDIVGSTGLVVRLAASLAAFSTVGASLTSFFSDAATAESCETGCEASTTAALYRCWLLLLLVSHRRSLLVLSRWRSVLWLLRVTICRLRLLRVALLGLLSIVLVVHRGDLASIEIKFGRRFGSAGMAEVEGMAKMRVGNVDGFCC